MTLCLSSLDFIVMKVLVRIWFRGVHSAMGHVPWLQGFDDLIYHSRIMLCRAWELGRFLEKWFATHDVTDVLGVVYLEYWL
jgi:hypothetical protein